MDPLNIQGNFEIRSLSRSWDNRGYPKKVGSPWIRPLHPCSKIFNGLLFGWNLWMYWPILKSVPFPAPDRRRQVLRVFADRGRIGYGNNGHLEFRPLQHCVLVRVQVSIDTWQWCQACSVSHRAHDRQAVLRQRHWPATPSFSSTRMHFITLSAWATSPE